MYTKCKELSPHLFLNKIFYFSLFKQSSVLMFMNVQEEVLWHLNVYAHTMYVNKYTNYWYISLFVSNTSSYLQKLLNYFENQTHIRDLMFKFSNEINCRCLTWTLSLANNHIKTIREIPIYCTTQWETTSRWSKFH